ncbi:ABC transporter ATP-binding protein [Candidatus Poribacteria bacterium]|nr:ABC transporter ATP-binding protein [Candidatus Poribacteria bacterium]
MIELRGVRRRWGSFSLKGITLKVERGEYFVLLGPCGAGKTLLLETIAGFWFPEEGEIWINGREVTRIPPERRNVGFVYQEYGLFPHLPVSENILYGLKARGYPKKERERRMMEVVSALGIEDLLEREEIGSLSGGEKQKVALARALAPEPEVMLLDEPLHSLDYSSREQVFRMLKEINRSFNITVIHVTHDYSEARALADRIGVMNNGRLIQVDEPDRIFERPSTTFIAKFLGAENLFRGRYEGEEGGFHLVRVGDSIKIKAHLDGRIDPVSICVRPEEVKVSASPLNLENEFEGIVREISDRGMFVRVILDVQGVRFISHLYRGEFLRLPISIGSRVRLGFRSESVCVLEEDEG